MSSVGVDKQIKQLTSNRRQSLSIPSSIIKEKPPILFVIIGLIKKSKVLNQLELTQFDEEMITLFIDHLSPSTLDVLDVKIRKTALTHFLLDAFVSILSDALKGIGFQDCQLGNDSVEYVLPLINDRGIDLIRFDLSSNFITDDLNVLSLDGVKHVNLSSNQLRSIPKQFRDLQSLTHLNLESNLISTIPEDLHIWKNLKILKLANNRIFTLPMCIVQGLVEYRIDLRNNPLPFYPSINGYVKPLSMNVVHFNTRVVLHGNSLSLFNSLLSTESTDQYIYFGEKEICGVPCDIIFNTVEYLNPFFMSDLQINIYSVKNEDDISSLELWYKELKTSYGILPSSMIYILCSDDKILDMVSNMPVFENMSFMFKLSKEIEDIFRDVQPINILSTADNEDKFLAGLSSANNSENITLIDEDSLTDFALSVNFDLISNPLVIDKLVQHSCIQKRGSLYLLNPNKLIPFFNRVLCGEKIQEILASTAPNSRVRELFEEYLSLSLYWYKDKMGITIPSLLKEGTTGGFEASKSLFIYSDSHTAKNQFTRRYKFNYVPSDFFYSLISFILQCTNTSAKEVSLNGFMIRSLEDMTRILFEIDTEKKVLSLINQPTELESCEFFKKMNRRINNFISKYDSSYLETDISVGNIVKYNFEIPYDYIQKCVQSGDDIIWERESIPLPAIAPDIRVTTIPEISETRLSDKVFLENSAHTKDYVTMLGDNLRVAVKSFYEEIDGYDNGIPSQWRDSLFEICQLFHPNLSRCYGVTIDPFSLVCEYLPVGSLGELLSNGFEFSTELSQRIIMEVAYGLEQIHTFLVHGNLRPDTVYIRSLDPSAEYVVALTDFGYNSPELVNHIQSPERVMKHSIWKWLPLEIIQKIPCTPTISSDIFSLGMILATVVSGKIPTFEKIQTYEDVTTENLLQFYVEVRESLPSNWDNETTSLFFTLLGISEKIRPKTMGEVIRGLNKGFGRNFSRRQIDNTDEEGKGNKKKVAIDDYAAAEGIILDPFERMCSGKTEEEIETKIRPKFEETLLCYSCGTVLFDVEGKQKGALKCQKGDIIWITGKNKDGWTEVWSDGKRGFIPSTHFYLAHKRKRKDILHQ
eukprot:TRINITY_DN9069_c0_g1_i1.p1 TRINITY_DN9069_c0_g1~~TRINITY_DN9069_c0_g1_i1.p1  ORF type:complete len:1094 (-),score=218.27 TRINITY_DN9069_c0_g1_i1:6-3287(-)